MRDHEGNFLGDCQSISEFATSWAFDEQAVAFQTCDEQICRCLVVPFSRWSPHYTHCQQPIARLGAQRRTEDPVIVLVMKGRL